jgi:hypothetical protein
MSEIALKPQKDLLDSIQSDFLWFKLNQLPSGGNAVINNESGKILTGDLALIGTTQVDTDFTTNDGWYENATASRDVCYENYTAAAQGEVAGSVHEMCRLDTLRTSGGVFVINAWLDMNAAGAGTEHIACYSANDTGAAGSGTNSYGGWDFYSINNLTHFYLTHTDSGTNADVDAYGTALAAGVHMITAVVDLASTTPNVTIYTDGAADAGGNAQKNLVAAAIPRGDSARGFRLLGKDTGVGSAGSTQEWGNNASSALHGVNNVTIWRFEKDVTSLIPSMIADLYATQRGLLPASFWGV